MIIKEIINPTKEVMLKRRNSNQKLPNNLVNTSKKRSKIRY